MASSNPAMFPFMAPLPSIEQTVAYYPVGHQASAVDPQYQYYPPAQSMYFVDGPPGWQYAPVGLSLPPIPVQPPFVSPYQTVAPQSPLHSQASPLPTPPLTPGSSFGEWSVVEPSSPATPETVCLTPMSKAVQAQIVNHPSMDTMDHTTPCPLEAMSPVIVVEDVDARQQIWASKEVEPRYVSLEEMSYIPCGWVEPADMFEPDLPHVNDVTPTKTNIVPEKRKESSTTVTPKKIKSRVRKPAELCLKKVKSTTQAAKVIKPKPKDHKTNDDGDKSPKRASCLVDNDVDRGLHVMELAKYPVPLLSAVELKRRDAFLECLIEGLNGYPKMTYPEAKRKYGFPEREGTMRGRMWNVRHPDLKGKRTPPWSRKDTQVLRELVDRHTKRIGLSNRPKICWQRIAEDFAAMHLRGEVAWPYCIKSCSKAWYEMLEAEGRL